MAPPHANDPEQDFKTWSLNEMNAHCGTELKENEWTVFVMSSLSFMLHFFYGVNLHYFVINIILWHTRMGKIYWTHV